MLFYVKITPKSAWAIRNYKARCYVEFYSTVEKAKLEIEINTTTSDDWTYEMVPNLCVRNIFGSDTWEGTKNWPHRGT